MEGSDHGCAFAFHRCNQTFMKGRGLLVIENGRSYLMMGRKCQVNKLKPFYDQSVYLAYSENIFSDFYCILIRLNDLFINC